MERKNIHLQTPHTTRQLLTYHCCRDHFQWVGAFPFTEFIYLFFLANPVRLDKPRRIKIQER